VVSKDGKIEVINPWVDQRTLHFVQ
jgi:hypothetical protein